MKKKKQNTKDRKPLESLVAKKKSRLKFYRMSLASHSIDICKKKKL